MSESDARDIFFDYYLLEKDSFFIVDKKMDGYDTNRRSINAFMEIATIQKAILDGFTIKIENLEQYNRDIRMWCADVGRDIDVHAFYVPENGDHAFSKHEDDRDVILTTIFGEKKMVLEIDGKEKVFTVNSDSYLYIPRGMKHYAIPTGESFMLSFGVPLELNAQI